MGYYAWRNRRPSERSEQNAQLLRCIERVHADSHGTYGSPRIQRALCMQGVRVGRNRVARLMRKHQIRARAAKIYRRNPGMHVFFETIPKQRLKVLSANPNAVWVGDITYLKLGASWRYLATVMDRCTRRVIGWSLGPKKNVRLTLQALDRAVHRCHHEQSALLVALTSSESRWRSAYRWRFPIGVPLAVASAFVSYPLAGGEDQYQSMAFRSWLWPSTSAVGITWVSCPFPFS